MEKRQKRILMLGGLRYLLPVIQAAHDLGYYVITCDYLPDNIAHKYSDEYHNISIIDKEAVWTLARKLQINGIMSFAVDPGVLTAAYVAEKMGLPGSPYQSVKILQDKSLFRRFLTEFGFNTPFSRGYNSEEEALKTISEFPWPVIVKPVDSAGSKGVTRVDHVRYLSAAIREAISNSISRQFIIEEFIEKEGYSSDSDAFSVNGELKYISFSDQRFDAGAINPYTPAAFSWPSTMKCEHQQELAAEVQRLLKLLNMGTSVYNIETCVGKDGKPYIMEVSPRGGGNRLSEMLRLATGVDLIKNSVRAAVGDEIVDISTTEYNGYWGELILHVNEAGIFEGITIDDRLKKYVSELDVWVKKGDSVQLFAGAGGALGTLVIRTKKQETLVEFIDHIHQYVNVTLHSAARDRNNE